MCINLVSGCQVSEFCTVTPNICVSPKWNLLHCHSSGSYNFEVAPIFLGYL
jgi:hypothetical protein